MLLVLPCFEVEVLNWRYLKGLSRRKFCIFYSIMLAPATSKIIPR